jgi:hypothetical protein
MILVMGSTAGSVALAARTGGGDDTRGLIEGSTPPPPRALVAPPRPEALPDPEPPGTGSVLEVSARVEVPIEGFLAWAALDRTTGRRAGSPNATDTSSTESMIKVWIVADHLRRVAEAGGRPSQRDLRDARLAIRHSHNATAQRLYAAGGHDAVVERMIDICGLVDTYIPEGGSGWWSRTEMSAEDAVRLGECLVSGTAAGPEWTDWVLAEMREVRGTTAPEDQRPEENFEGGRWGIIDGLPRQIVERGVSIKNGWTRIGRDDSWHVNCLAVAEDWVMAVMMRYPAAYSLDYGAERCASVARQLIPDPAPAPAPPPAPTIG